MAQQPFALIAVIALTSFCVLVNAQCNKNATSCGQCGLSGDNGCAWCESNHTCYDQGSQGIDCPSGCSDCYVRSCSITSYQLLIILCSIGGVLGLIILFVLWCWCCRGREAKALKAYTFKENQKDLAAKRAREERAVVRRDERKERSDEIRRKYGIREDDRASFA